MENTRTFSISEKTVDLVISKLKAIQLSSEDNTVLTQVNHILDIFENITKPKEACLKDIIYKTMQEVKNDDPDLHFNLYMLYRKIEDVKISEEDAKDIFETYMKMRQFDKILCKRY